VRLDAKMNADVEALAEAAGTSVSEYIRALLADVAARQSRIAGHQRALEAFKNLPQLADPDVGRSEMWGIGSRVPD
jgi:Arc/MetJ-type ribon-helix-helix transcriptional regulator